MPAEDAAARGRGSPRAAEAAPRTWPRRPPRLQPVRVAAARTEQRRPSLRGPPLGPAGGCLEARSGREAGADEEVGRQARGRAPAQAPELEIEHELGEPTIWLNRALPDPTPASARLKRAFAKQLVAASKRHGADWAAVLGVLRAQGERGAVPATAAELDALAARLAGQDTWKGALALSGRTAFADRAAALADLYRLVGIEALVIGFEASKQQLTEACSRPTGVLVYDGGR